MLVGGDISAREFVSCATRLLPGERTQSLVEPVLGLAAQAADLWSPDDQRDALLAAVAATAATIVERGDHMRREAVRTLARTAVTEEQLAAADAAADEPDLRWHLQVRLAALGRHDGRAVAELEETDPDPDAWVRALAARAAQPDPGAKDEAWDALVPMSRVPLAAVGMVGRAFWQRGQDAVLASYADRFLAALPDLGHHGMISAMAIPQFMFPLVGVGADFPDRVVAATRPAEVNAVVRRTAASRADEGRRMLAARSRR